MRCSRNALTTTTTELSDMPTPDMPDGVEILSGLRSGDVLVAS